MVGPIIWAACMTLAFFVAAFRYSEAATECEVYRRRFERVQGRYDELRERFDAGAARGSALQRDHATLRRRFRAVLSEARAWKGWATSHGWTREEWVNAPRRMAKAARKAARNARKAAA